MMAEVEALGARATEPDAHEIAARMNLRLAQLGWPVVAEVEAGEAGSEQVLLRLLSFDRTPDVSILPLHVGVASLARPNLIESLVVEIRARGWSRSDGRPAPLADAPWCAPA